MHNAMLLREMMQPYVSFLIYFIFVHNWCDEGRVPAIVLNLDRSPERLEHIMLQCNFAGIPCFRYPALDGKTLHMGALLESGKHLRHLFDT